MKRSRTQFDRSARRRRTAWYALAAMLFYSLAPLLPTPAAAATLVQICTVHGIVTIAVPDGEEPAPAGAMPDCLACALTVHAGPNAQAFLPADVTVPLPAPPPSAAPLPVFDSDRAGMAVTNAKPRAPPLPV